MNDHKMDQGAIGKITLLESPQNEEAPLPPWMFRHNDLISALASAGNIDKKKLTNILNYLHFKGNHIYALLNHPLYEEGILVKIHPKPCSGDELICHWDQAYSTYKLERYHFQYLIVSHDQSVILVPAQMLVMNGDGLTITLPETSLVISKRQSPRFACHDVKAELWQSGFQAVGELIDFNPHTFRIRVQSAPLSSFNWFNVEAPVTIRLSNDKHVFYSGNCSCMYQKQNGQSREIVVAPTQDQIPRFKAKVFRNPRRQTSPPLYAVFNHPFMKKIVQREIFDISTTGFSVCDKSDEAVLMPGLIIPDMTISYAGILKIHCKVQVIYQKVETSVRFGMAILDMDLKNYNNLNKLLDSMPGVGQGMTNEINLDELWDLFFDTNFMYPAKYGHIEAFREAFQETYRKLYSNASEIAKHFTCQKNGRIYSHVSLLRAYDKAWMIHHHAARPMNDKYMGFIVIKQLILYLNGAHLLPSAHMDYAFCYLRPENKFNERIYAGFTQEQNNTQITSLDLFSYHTYETETKPAPLPSGWSLQECSTSDLWELKQFYNHHSGGLLWDMLCLDSRQQEESLEKVYAGMGFIRRWKPLALHCCGDLRAVIIAEESDVAINLSDLLNGFKVLIIDPKTPPEIIISAVGNLTMASGVKSVPLMIYPSTYAKTNGLYNEKEYYLWILDVQHGNAYMKYLARTYRIKLE
jgi:hypothetical protein